MEFFWKEKEFLFNEIASAPLKLKYVNDLKAYLQGWEAWPYTGLSLLKV